MLAEVEVWYNTESYRICEPDNFGAIISFVMTCRDLFVLRFFPPAALPNSLTESPSSTVDNR